jgi:hypothetical protein
MLTNRPLASMQVLTCLEKDPLIVRDAGTNILCSSQRVLVLILVSFESWRGEGCALNE